MNAKQLPHENENATSCGRLAAFELCPSDGNQKGHEHMRQFVSNDNPGPAPGEQTGANAAAVLTLLTCAAARSCANRAARERLLVALRATKDATAILQRAEAAAHV